MIKLPKNTPPHVEQALGQIANAETLGTALNQLAPAISELFLADDAIFVFQQESSNINLSVSAARFFSQHLASSNEEENLLDQWFKSGAHRAVIEELANKLTAVSFSEDLWPYGRGHNSAHSILKFPRRYNLLIPFGSDLIVHSDKEEDFFGYFYLLYERFPEIEETLLSLIINLPKLVSEVIGTLNRQFARRDRSLGAFAHDFKQYLLLNEQYLNRLRDPSNHDPLLVDRLVAANQRMLLQTDSVILSNREGHGFLTVRTVDLALNEIVLEAVHQFEPSYHLANIQLALEFEDGLPTVSLDPALFPSVINNLLDNARKYSPKGSTVTIVTRLEHSGRDGVVVEVIDQGIGIPESDQPQVFGKNYRATNANVAAGHGLGLFLSKKIVEAHRGSISVASKVGSGTSFSVFLPTASRQLN